jgi:hypothetical protein
MKKFAYFRIVTITIENANQKNFPFTFCCHSRKNFCIFGAQNQFTFSSVDIF